MDRKAKSWARLGLYTLIWIGAGCQQNEMQSASDMQSPDRNSSTTTLNEKLAVSDGVSVDQQIEGAKMDLASILGVEVDVIAVKEARSVQWGSGALGCPKPGMSYTQALVPGLRVLLEVDGAVYYYHGGRGSMLFNCPAKLAQAPAYGPGEEVM